MDSEAFDRLYSEHADGLLGFLTYQTGNRALAEDIVADTFERVLTARRGWRGESGQKTWLYSIAMNRLRDIARRKDAETRAMGRVRTVQAPQDGVAAVTDRDALRSALQDLPEDERVVVALRFGGDLSLRDIADLLGERQSTIEGRLYRGLRHLRSTVG
ncbi:MAG TPA: sigma-70 family RNA polymerase sigma factor [Baekduia sp.]|nr:sigma-70 family RNA polymerase sigma factor [Baekduia sp.]